ncbi:hypothetical protein NS2R_10365 [Pseudomonas oryzihabitans]|nr:hypothetical protein NS2R_10365 [Pseudomonas psychrotolerans]
MTLCLFLTAYQEDAASDLDRDWLDAGLAEVHGVRELILHLPFAFGQGDPHLVAAEPPRCVIQLYFPSLAALEQALVRQGPLARLLTRAELTGYRWTQQAMLVRSFMPAAGASQRSTGVTYLVEYDGHSADDDHWLACYLRQHPPLLALLPGVRAVEVYTRLDYCSDLPIARARALQRNKVVFDSAAALATALASPQRDRLREDFLSLPTFTGTSPHYPMQSVARLP